MPRKLLYAVDYVRAHMPGHGLMIFDTREQAEQAYSTLKELETMADMQGYADGFMQHYNSVLQGLVKGAVANVERLNTQHFVIRPLHRGKPAKEYHIPYNGRVVRVVNEKEIDLLV